MGRPKAWKEYISHVKAAGTTPNQMLANFAARYRFARSLDDLSLPGFSQPTKEGYLVATRVAYAYSALEALERGIGKYSVKTRSEIVDFRLAKKLAIGEFDAAVAQIIDAAEQRHAKSVREGFKTMFDRLETGNVRPFIEGIRNSLFHGKFTPTASGLTSSKSRRKAFSTVADEILLTADAIFASWLHAEMETEKLDSAQGLT